MNGTCHEILFYLLILATVVGINDLLSAIVQLLLLLQKAGTPVIRCRHTQPASQANHTGNSTVVPPTSPVPSGLG